jgi:hypothetical protein
MDNFNEKHDGLVGEVHTDETGRPAGHLDEVSSTPSNGLDDVEKGSQTQSTC